ncbi:MAG: hypothetical protein H6825_09340 [Planctomycetes bacterium]|nr:hypothetical protein [Planctomycetota bacterium]
MLPRSSSRLLRSAVLVGVALGSPWSPSLTAQDAASIAPAAQAAPAATLPGYYEWYRKAGEDPRLPDEVRRDASPEDATWAPRKLARVLPELKLPNGDGERVDLLAGDGRWTVIVTTQAWW